MLYVDSVLYDGVLQSDIFEFYVYPNNEKNYDRYRFIFYDTSTGNYDNVKGSEVVNYIVLSSSGFMALTPVGDGFSGFVLNEYGRAFVNKLCCSNKKLHTFLSALSNPINFLWSVDDSFVYVVDLCTNTNRIMKFAIKNRDGGDLKRSLLKWQISSGMSFKVDFLGVDYFKSKLI